MFFENYVTDITSGVYRELGSYTLRNYQNTISLTIEGHKKLSIEKWNYDNIPIPYFCFSFKHELLKCTYTNCRENWVVGYQSDFVERNSSNDSVNIFFDRDKTKFVNIPRFTPLSMNEAIRLRDEMNTVYGYRGQVAPFAKFRCFLGWCKIITFIIDKHQEQQEHGVAWDFRRLLDDINFIDYSLEDLSQRCSYSLDHLSILFKKQYFVTPHRYRIQRNMTYALDLIMTTNLAVKEIAAKCGFAYLSHFSTQFKSVHGFSPREALKKFRHGSLTTTGR
jgi:AraC-like DNA-binding protein